MADVELRVCDEPVDDKIKELRAKLSSMRSSRDYYKKIVGELRLEVEKLEDKKYKLEYDESKMRLEAENKNLLQRIENLYSSIKHNDKVSMEKSKELERLHCENKAMRDGLALSKNALKRYMEDDGKNFNPKKSFLDKLLRRD
jgi:chromosome segregation ATPase